jgi:hypothetical protein
MALTKDADVDQITVTENGTVLVREVTTIKEDGTEISKKYHRISLQPGEDISSQIEKVKAICNAAWTPEVIAAYKAQQAVYQTKTPVGA